MQNNKWKPGLPPGDYYEGMLDDYEVYYSPGGAVWHRKKSPTKTEELTMGHKIENDRRHKRPGAASPRGMEALKAIAAETQKEQIDKLKQAIKNIAYNQNKTEEQVIEEIEQYLKDK